jgi:hypothetical protein
MSQYKTSIFQKFFWLISGSEINVLKDCKHDYNRHATIGFVLFMTTIFASISGFSAGHFFSHGNFTISVGFALLWAMLIYAIDRSMIVSLKKKEEIDSLPISGKAKHYAIPFLSRALIGVMIGFFMSIPIEIIVFQDNIIIQIDAENKQKVLDEANFVHRKNDKTGKEAIKSGADNEKAEIENLLLSDCPLPEYTSNVGLYKSNLPKQNQLYDNYIKARNYANSIPQTIWVDKEEVQNPSYKDAVGERKTAWNAYDRQKKVCDGYVTEYKRIDREWRALKETEKTSADSLSKAYASKLAAIAQEADTTSQNKEDLLKQLNGFTRQYEALTHAAKKPENGSLFFLLWLIRLIFIGVEILPTLTKIMTPIGDYDRAIRYREEMFNEELLTDLESKKTAEGLRRTSNAEIATKTEAYRQGKEVELNKTLIDEVARVQTEIATSHLTEWEKKEKDRSEKKVDDFMKGKS